MKKLLLIASISAFLLMSCGEAGDSKIEAGKSNDNTEAMEESSGGANDGKGVGPIKSVTLGDIDQAMATEGEELFKTNCSACHKMEKRFVGPSLAKVTERRKPEWIMNMIMNPEKMVKEDPVAQELLAEYLAPMANQNITEDQARKILEHFRNYDNN
jgi:mono/diheme cytochrome c family protein